MNTKKILTEQLPSNSLEYLKEDVENKSSHILGRLKGICAECDQPTRNGRVYSKTLWEKVINSDTFNEYISTKTLYGELNHPADRLETDITKVAIALSDIEFKPDGSVIGTFDILNTPNGQILKSLCDYGSKLGVSSRGGGEIVSRGNNEYVDEDSYDFIAFDVVALPAVAKARPAVIESVEYKEKILPLKESLLKQVKESDNKSHLTSIKSVVESLNMPENDSKEIVESINIKLDSMEGENDTSILLKDLNESIKKIQTLEKENASLLEKLSAGTTRESKIEEEINQLKDAMKVLATKARKAEALEKLNEDLRNKSSQRISLLQEQNKHVKDRFNQLKEDQITRSDEIKILEQRFNQENENLAEQVKSLTTKLADEKKLAESKLQESTSKLQSDNKDILMKHKMLNEKLIKEQERLKQFTQNNKSILENYLSLACKFKGLDKQDVLKKLGEVYTVQQIDKIVEEATDYNIRIGGLPFNIGGVKAIIEGKQDPMFESRKINSNEEDLSGAYELLKKLENK